MITHYQTIIGTSEGIYKEKGSKFIGLAHPVSDVHEVKSILGDIESTYHDGRHHCYAYVLGPEGKEYRANDDGEPNHSAGDPILGQINSHKLTNILVVVVRYFGGTKLGVSGLINAYKTAANEAIAHAQIVTRAIKERFKISYAYDATSEVMRLIHEVDGEIESQSFTESCNTQIAVSIDKTDILRQKMNLLKNLGVTIEWEHVQHPK